MINETIPKLLTALQSVCPDENADAEAVADWLWLAAHSMPSQKGQQDESSPRKADRLDNKEAEQSDSGQQLESEVTNRASDSDTLEDSTSHSEGDPEPDQSENLQKSSTPLYSGGQGTGTGSGLPLRVPGGRALPHSLALVRALRPLKQQVETNDSWIIDEEATVRRIADTGIWIPVLKANKQRWLELALVLDESPSMRLWYDTVKEFRALLVQLGAFRDIRTWRLKTSGKDQRVDLHAGEGEAPCHFRGLVNTARPRLIVIVSDFISPAWQGEELIEWLNVWGREHPANFIQLLPQRLWQQSRLRTARLLKVTNPASETPNSRFHVHQPALPWAKPVTKKAIPFPLISLEPDPLADWAHFIVGNKKIELPAFQLQPIDQPIVIAPKNQSEENERLQQFRAAASPIAYKLACFLAAAPLMLPVMRLVQRVLVPESGQSHLAEFFLSGLIKRVNTDEEIIDPDKIVYDFLSDNLRNTLLESGLITDAVRVQEEISRFINEHYDDAFSFQAIISDPKRTGNVSVSEKLRPFAKVTGSVLDQLGGEYAEAALDISELAQPARRITSNEVRESIPDQLTELVQELQRKQVGDNAKESGSGAIAQGEGSIATGEKGIAVKDDVNGGVRQVHAETYVEQQVLEQEDKSYAALRCEYLRQVIQQTGFLALDGIDPKSAGSSGGSRLNLGAVYTGLLTNSLSEQEGREGPEIREKQKPLSALAMLDRHPRLVLLGDPGSGKSTFVNFVALCFAGEALGHAELNLALLRTPLPAEKENEKEVEAQPWQHGPLLPVRIILRDFAARGLPEDPEAEASCDHLARFLTVELGDRLADFSLMTELAEHGGLVMFDGLDEVPEANQCRLQIKQVLESFLQTFPKCRVLVTSRTYAYLRQQWRIPSLVQAELVPFSDAQVRFFIGQWYAHIGERKALQKEEQEGRAALLQQAVFASPRLRELAERPLLLGLMVSLHAWRGGSLPENREELYADTVDLLLDLWENPKIVYDREGQVALQQLSLAVYLQTDRSRVRRLLEELAFAAHAGQPELSGTADIQEDELVMRLLALNNGEVSPTALRDYLSQRAGLLTPRGVGVYTFYHRTFQEYLAACYLTDHAFPEQAAALGQEDPARWREALLLAGAKAGRGSRANIWQLSDELCPQPLVEATAELEQLQGTLLAGQVLADCVDTADLLDSANKLGRRNRIILARVQQGLKNILSGSRLTATDRVAAGNALARLGDSRFRPDCWFLPDEELLGFAEIPAGEFLMGDDGDGVAKPQHMVRLDRYFIARYPVTVAQFRFFIKESGYQPSDRSCLEGIANHPVRFVNWYDAMAYCAWLDQELRSSTETPTTLAVLLQQGWKVGLSSEAEWEKAARGEDGRTYPWGEEKLNAERANCQEAEIKTTSPVGCFSGGVSPYGLLDCSGNLWEWTRSVWGENWEKPEFVYPYDPTDIRRENISTGRGMLRVLRGGSYVQGAINLTCAYRFRFSPDILVEGFWGFRIVLTQKK